MNYANLKYNVNHLVKATLGRLEWLFGNPQKVGELIVVNYHGTQQKFILNFEKQLKFFLKHFSIISPADVPLFYNGLITKTNKPYLLLTFDDGVLNNLLAVELLNKYNLKGLFFIVPDFINTDEKEQKNYFIKNIRPVINPKIDHNNIDFKAINWNDLKTLQMQGHFIGSHTKTHTLVTSDPLNKITAEIIDSKCIIEQNIPLNTLDSFCSINETSLSVNKSIMELIRKHYSYFYSTYPGSNEKNKNKYLIYRCNIESNWLPGAVKYAMGKWDQRRWKTKINNFNESIL